MRLRLEELPSLAELPADGLLQVEEVAAYLGVAPSTTEKWRAAGDGPPWFRLHNGPKSPVRYRVDKVREWLDARQTDTSEGTDTPARVA